MDNIVVEVEDLDSGLRKQNGERCVVCEENKLKGIHLYTAFICMDCEEDILITETDDPKYKYYLQKLKKITTPEIFS
jgi:uncharacterized protein (DUF983 family)